MIVRLLKLVCHLNPHPPIKSQFSLPTLHHWNMHTNESVHTHLIYRTAKLNRDLSHMTMSVCFHVGSRVKQCCSFLPHVYGKGWLKYMQRLSAEAPCTQQPGLLSPALPPSAHTVLIMSWRKRVFICAFQRPISLTYFRLSPKRPRQLKQPDATNMPTVMLRPPTKGLTLRCVPLTHMGTYKCTSVICCFYAQWAVCSGDVRCLQFK